MFTDIHFGKKNNSDLHNNDCVKFLKWFSTQIKLINDIDHIIFLGDWFENRNAINVNTLNYSYNGAKILNDLELPVYFIIGNHDLYSKHTRDIHATIFFNEFNNFNVIDHPIICNNTYNDILLCPFIFNYEYNKLDNYINIPIWFGHFEFNGFKLTGHNTLMENGLDINFDKQMQIFSGHFHKRQSNKNIHYIGNVFPQDYGDSGDLNRGMATYDHTTNKMQFFNWKDCPKYLKTKLSLILDEKIPIKENAYIECIIDEHLSHSDSIQLKSALIKKYNLREFIMTETTENSKAVSDTTVDDEIIVDNIDDIGLTNVDEMIVNMLGAVNTKNINSDTLIKIYTGLRVET